MRSTPFHLTSVPPINNPNVRRFSQRFKETSSTKYLVEKRPPIQRYFRSSFFIIKNYNTWLKKKKESPTDLERAVQNGNFGRRHGRGKVHGRFTEWRFTPCGHGSGYTGRSEQDGVTVEAPNNTGVETPDDVETNHRRLTRWCPAEKVTMVWILGLTTLTLGWFPRPTTVSTSPTTTGPGKDVSSSLPSWVDLYLEGKTRKEGRVRKKRTPRSLQFCLRRVSWVGTQDMFEGFEDWGTGTFWGDTL